MRTGARGENGLIQAGLSGSDDTPVEVRVHENIAHSKAPEPPLLEAFREWAQIELVRPGGPLLPLSLIHI